MRIVGPTVLAEPGVVVADAEIEIDRHGLVNFLGPRRGEAGVGDLDGSRRVAVPGLTNAHTHSAMTLLRGYSDDVPLHTWLTHVRAFELRMTAADLAAGLRLAMVEMLRSGTVSFVDMFAWDAALLGEVVSAGMRVNACSAVFDRAGVAFPLGDPRTGGQIVDETPELAAEFRGEPGIIVSYGLHATYTCAPDLIADVARRARRDDLGVQIHLAETRREVDASIAEHGVSPIRHAADLGLFETRLHVAHAVHPVDGDIELLAGPNVTVAHNPVSNLKLGAGIAPTPAYRDAGVRLSLGTDSVASNNTLDLFEEIKLAGILQRGVAEDAAVLRGAEVLGWATQGGAAAAAAGGTGRIRVGETADLVLLDATATTATPLYDAESYACYAATGADVVDVFIGGRRVVADGRVLTLDEAAVRADVRERAARITAEIGGRPGSA